MRFAFTFIAAGLALAAAPTTLADEFNISQASGLFSPSFRDTTNTDANKTWFGWDVLEDSGVPGLIGGQRLDDDTPDINAAGAPTGARFKQDDDLTWGHISGTNRYYSGFDTTGIPGTSPSVAGDTFTVPIGGPGDGSGYTSILIQILAQPANAPELLWDPVGGVDPVVNVAGVNANGDGQYWVLYELTGSEPTYDVRFSSEQTSVALTDFVIDTAWSETAFVEADTVVVPEPTAAAVLATGGLGLLLRRRCRAKS